MRVLKKRGKRDGRETEQTEIITSGVLSFGKEELWHDEFNQVMENKPQYSDE